MNEEPSELEIQPDVHLLLLILVILDTNTVYLLKMTDAIIFFNNYLAKIKQEDP